MTPLVMTKQSQPCCILRVAAHATRLQLTHARHAMTTDIAPQQRRVTPRAAFGQLCDFWEGYLALTENCKYIQSFSGLACRFENLKVGLQLWTNRPDGLSFESTAYAPDYKSARTSVLAGALCLDHGIAPLAQRVLEVHTRRLSSIRAVTSAEEQLHAIASSRLTTSVAQMLATAATSLSATVAATSPWGPGAAPVIPPDEALPGGCGQLTAAGVRRQLLLQLMDPGLTGAVAGAMAAMHRAAGGWDGTQGAAAEKPALNSTWVSRSELLYVMSDMIQYLYFVMYAVYHEVRQIGGWLLRVHEAYRSPPDPNQPPPPPPSQQPPQPQQQQQQRQGPQEASKGAAPGTSNGASDGPRAGQAGGSTPCTWVGGEEQHSGCPEPLQGAAAATPRGQLLLPPLVDRLVHALEAGGLLDTLCRLLFTAPMRNGVATSGSTGGSSDSGTPCPSQLNVAQVLRMDALGAELHMGRSWDSQHSSSVRCLAASLHGLVELLAPALPPGLPIPVPAQGPSGTPGAPPAPALRGLLLLLSPAVQRVQVCLLRRFLALHGDEAEDAEEGEGGCNWEWGLGVEGLVQGPGDKGDGRRAGGTVGDSQKGRQRQAAVKGFSGPKGQAGAGAGSREVARGSGWPLLDAVWNSRGSVHPLAVASLLLECPIWTWAAACRLPHAAAASASGGAGSSSSSGGSGGISESGDSDGGTAGSALPPLPVLLRRLRRVLLAVRRAVRRPELVGGGLGLTKRGVVCACEVAYYGVWGVVGRLGSPGAGEELASCLPPALELVGIAADVASWLVADRSRQAGELGREQQQGQQDQGPGGTGEAGAGGGSGAGRASSAAQVSLLQGDCAIGKVLLDPASTCAVALGRGWTSGAPSSASSHGAFLGGIAALPPAAAHEARERLLRCGWLHTCTRALRLAARARAEVAAGLAEAAGQLLQPGGQQQQRELHSLIRLCDDRQWCERAAKRLLQAVSPVWLLLSPPEPGAHSPTAAGGSLPSPGATSTSAAPNSSPAGASSAGVDTSAAAPAAPAAASLLSVSPSACGAVCELLVSASKAVHGAAVAVRQLRGAGLLGRQQQQHQHQQYQPGAQLQQRQPGPSNSAGGTAPESQKDKELGAYGAGASAGSHTQQQVPCTHGGPDCSGAGTDTTIDTGTPTDTTTAIATATTTTATATGDTIAAIATACNHTVPPVSDPNWAWLAHNAQVLEAEQRHWVDCFQVVIGTLLVLVLTGRQPWLLTVPEPSAPELRDLDPAARRGSTGSHGPVVACGQDQAAALRGAAAHLMCAVGRTALEELRGVEEGLHPLLEWGWKEQGGHGVGATRPEEQGNAAIGGVPMRGQGTGQGQGQGNDTQHTDSGTAREIGQGQLQQRHQHQEQWILLRDITSRLFYRVSVFLGYLVCPLCDWLPGGRGHVAWLLPPPRSLQRLLVGSCQVLLCTTRAAASLPPSLEHTADVKNTSQECVTYLLGAVLRLSCHAVLGPHVRRWLGRRLGELAGEAAVGAAAGGAGGISLQPVTAAAATASNQLQGVPGPEGLTLVHALAELVGSVDAWRQEAGVGGSDLTGLVERLARAVSGEQRAAEAEERAGVGMRLLAEAGDGGGASGGSRVGEEAFREAARALAAEWTRLLFGAEALPPSLRAQQGKGQAAERQVEQGHASGGVGGERQEGVYGEGALEVDVEAPRVCGNPECVNFEGDAEGELKFRRCGGCGAVRYCGADCQRAHWRAGHREECKR